ncbi:hypothetical protein Tco_0198389 [Tanacetum coccineum]
MSFTQIDVDTEGERVYGLVEVEGVDERVEDLNGQGNDLGLGANGGVEGVDGNVKGANGGVEGVNGKALTCHEMQKLESELWNHVMIGASHVAYTNRFHELARMVATTEPKTMQKAV